MSNKIKKIIYSKTPVNNIDSLINVCSIGTGIECSNNYLVYDINSIYYAEAEGIFKIIFQYVYNKGIINIVDFNTESETVIVHNESMFYNILNKNENVLKYFVPIKDIEIIINSDDETEEIRSLVQRIKDL